MNPKNTSDLYCIWADNLPVHAFPVTQIHELSIANTDADNDNALLRQSGNKAKIAKIEWPKWFRKMYMNIHITIYSTYFYIFHNHIHHKIIYIFKSSYRVNKYTYSISNMKEIQKQKNMYMFIYIYIYSKMMLIRMWCVCIEHSGSLIKSKHLCLVELLCHSTFLYLVKRL